MKQVTLSTELVNAMMQYLAAKPYQEVYQLIDSIQKEAAKSAEQEAKLPE